MRYSKEIYSARRSYSSDPDLSLKKALRIDANNYNGIPDALESPSGEIQLYDSLGNYLPLMPYENSPWKVSPGGWVTHKETGIKVKLEEKVFPSYFTTTITVKTPIDQKEEK